MTNQNIRIGFYLDNIVLSGGCIRVSRFAETARALGVEAVVVTFSTNIVCEWQLDLPVLSVEEARARELDFIIIPGAGFSPDSIARFCEFNDPAFGVRVQWLLNDYNFKDRFLKVAQSFDPQIVVANNSISWSPERLQVFAPATVHAVDGAVDCDLFVNSGRERNANGTIRIIGSAYKNPEPLIQALSSLPDNVTLTLIGNVPSSVQQYANELKLGARLDFTGPVEPTELPTHYQASDIAVTTEIMAGWTNMAAEASASGLPLVCTRAGTQVFARHGETALILDAPEPLLIAEAVMSLINNPAAASQMANQARKNIEQYSWHRYAETMMQLLTA